MRMNIPMYFGSEVYEEPQDLLDEVYITSFSIGVSTTEKAKLSAYQLLDVAQTCYNQWKDIRALGGGSVTCEIFKNVFLDKLFQREQKIS